jgi:hypothetical protein
MRKHLPGVCVAAVAALGVACGDNARQAVNPVGPGAYAEQAIPTAGTGATAAQSVARRLAGTLDGRFDFSRMWGAEWWQFYSDSDATGTLSHFGLTRMRTSHIPDLETGALTQGEFTIVAANGDEVHGTYDGTAAYDPDRADVVHGTATFVVSGGTGRFAGATGSITATLLETMDDPSFASAKVSWTLAGTIYY